MDASLWEGLRACCYLLPWIISSCTVSFLEMEGLTRRLVIWHLKSQQQKTSLLFCLLPEQRAAVCAGLSIGHPLCRLCPRRSCCGLTSALGSVGSISQIKKQKKRPYSLQSWWPFLLCPHHKGQQWGWTPHGGPPAFHQGCFIPENARSSWSPSPS